MLKDIEVRHLDEIKKYIVKIGDSFLKFDFNRGEITNINTVIDDEKATVLVDYKAADSLAKELDGEVYERVTKLRKVTR